jgi:hypothetical protein
MRRIIILGLTLAMSAFAFNNCAYPDWEPQPSTGTEGGDEPVTPVDPSKAFSVVANVIQTKSEADAEGTIVWSEGDQINVFHAVSGETTLLSDGAATLDAASENTFKGSLSKGLKEKWSYDWFMFYPYTKDLALVDNAAAVTIGSAAAGVQTQTGYDNKAHVSGKGMPLYGTVMGVEEGKVPAADLNHIASVLELDIISCMPQAVNISEVKITAGEDIVGSYTVDFVTGTVTPVEGATSKTAVLKVNEPGALENGQTAKFYFVVKPFTAAAGDVFKISVNGSEKEITLKDALVFAPGKTTALEYTYYDISLVSDSLVGMYKIHYFWVYGGTGPEWNCGGWVDLHNKTWWFDLTSGHGIAAERDNYLEFTLTDLLDGGVRTTGKCYNWAGKDGKNWSAYFHNSKINGGEPTDGRHFYRQIPLGESTWVRDYTKTPNTITFTDSEGRQTVVEMLEPKYTFVPGYSDSQAEANTRVFPRNTGSGDHDDLTFHAKLSSTDNWDVAGQEIDKVYYRPRDFFIDVDRVESIPAEAKTVEAQYDPSIPVNPYPETLAGTYKYATDYTVGGKDGSITVKGLTDQYATWEPAASKVNKIKNDKYTFVVTGTDANGNETGTVTFDDGGDGTWEYQLYDNMANNKEYNGIELYGFIAHDNTTTYVYDRNKATITFTTREKEYVVDYLLPGQYTYSTKDVTVPTSATFAMHYDMKYTEARVANYSNTGNGFARHYVWARDWVLCVTKQ